PRRRPRRRRHARAPPRESRPRRRRRARRTTSPPRRRRKQRPLRRRAAATAAARLPICSARCAARRRRSSAVHGRKTRNADRNPRRPAFRVLGIASADRSGPARLRERRAGAPAHGVTEAIRLNGARPRRAVPFATASSRFTSYAFATVAPASGFAPTAQGSEAVTEKRGTPSREGASRRTLARSQRARSARWRRSLRRGGLCARGATERGHPRFLASETVRVPREVPTGFGRCSRVVSESRERAHAFHPRLFGELARRKLAEQGTEELRRSAILTSIARLDGGEEHLVLFGERARRVRGCRVLRHRAACGRARPPIRRRAGRPTNAGRDFRARLGRLGSNRFHIRRPFAACAHERARATV